jgi:hypothetical protein
VRSFCKKNLLYVIALISFYALFSSSAVFAIEPASSRAEPLPQGCAWKLFDSTLGLRMQIRNCASDGAQDSFATNGDWIDVRHQQKGQSIEEIKLIKVLRKQADQPIEETIQQTFIDALEGEAKVRCKLRAPTENSVKHKDKIILEIAPTDTNDAKVVDKQKKNSDDHGCGAFSGSHGLAYFEYHPSEDPTKYLFVTRRVDLPLFDENSLQLYQTSAKNSGVNWMFVAADDFSKIFYDPISRKTNQDDIVTLDTLTDYDPSSKKAESFHLAEKGLSEIEKISLDCVNKKYRSEGGRWFNGRMAAGDIQKTYPSNEQWKTIPDFYIKLFDTVCRQ